MVWGGHLLQAIGLKSRATVGAFHFSAKCFSVTGCPVYFTPESPLQKRRGDFNCLASVPVHAPAYIFTPTGNAPRQIDTSVSPFLREKRMSSTHLACKNTL